MALSYNDDVKDRQRNLKLPAFFAAGSFLVIVSLTGLTNPIDKVGYSLIFFAGLFILLVSLGYLTVALQHGYVGAKNRLRIVIVSLFLLIALMFRSAQSLGWIDALILLLIVIGLLFYSTTRTS